jgi:protoporphyrinogen oxidase
LFQGIALVNRDEDRSNIIVGAGLTGLTCGYHLVSGHEKCIVLEKEAVIGGLARSVVFQDCVFDLGPHVLFCKENPRAIEFVKGVLKPDEYSITDLAISFFLYGRYYNLPLSIPDFLRFPIPTALSFLKAILRKKGKGADFKSDMSSIMGKRMYEDYFGPFIEKKVGRVGERLHSDWIRRPGRNHKNDLLEDRLRIETDKHGRWALLEKLLLALRLALPRKDKVLYPKQGIQMIPHRLWERYSQMGGITLLNAEGVRLCKSGSKIESVTLRDREGRERELAVKNLIWTGSVNQLCQLLSIDSDLTYVGCALVFVVLKGKLRKKIRALYTYYIQPEISFNRLYFPSYLDKRLVPEGKEALCAEIPLTENSKILGKPDMMKRVKEDLEKLGLIKATDLLSMEYVELGGVYPVYPVDYRERLQRIYGQLQRYDNLYPVGRLGSFYFAMMPGVIDLSMETARHILSTPERTGQP